LTPLRRSLLRERRIFGRRQLLSLLKKLCALHKKRRIKHNILLEEEVAKEEEEGIISKEKGLIFIACDAIEMDMMLPHISCLGT